MGRHIIHLPVINGFALTIERVPKSTIFPPAIWGTKDDVRVCYKWKAVRGKTLRVGYVEGRTTAQEEAENYARSNPNAATATQSSGAR